MRKACRRLVRHVERCLVRRGYERGEGIRRRKDKDVLAVLDDLRARSSLNNCLFSFAAGRQGE